MIWELQMIYEEVSMDAVKRGDMETAQRMVDEAAKRAGYYVKAYHGSPSWKGDNSDWTEFRTKKFMSYFFASNKKDAQMYADGNRPSWEARQAPPGIVKAFYIIPKGEVNERDTIFEVSNPSQIKLADPVTYENGEIIPLSERFNQSTGNIKY